MCNGGKLFPIQSPIFRKSGKPGFFEEEFFFGKPDTANDPVFHKRCRRKGKPSPTEKSPNFFWFF
jgi:hypothetical protein